MNVKTIAALGTGTMGHGVAELCAHAGFEVYMYGRTKESIERGYESIKANLELLKKDGKLTDDEAKAVISRIKGVTTIKEAAEKADFVIESLAEDLQLKRDVFEELDKICRDDVVLATNTSGLSPSAISKNLIHPERMLVAHFWNPPQLIPLVEIVPGEKTSQGAMKIAADWVNAIGKKDVTMKKECLGFIGNRLQFALLREALYIVDQGWADAEEVDKAVEYGLGRRLPVTGPLRSADLGGLDVLGSVAEYLLKDLSRAAEVPKLLKDKMQEGKFGVKTGEGFYKWEEESKLEIQNKRKELLLEFMEKDKSK